MQQCSIRHAVDPSTGLRGEFGPASLYAFKGATLLVARVPHEEHAVNAFSAGSNDWQGFAKQLLHTRVGDALLVFFHGRANARLVGSPGSSIVKIWVRASRHDLTNGKALPMTAC